MDAGDLAAEEVRGGGGDGGAVGVAGALPVGAVAEGPEGVAMGPLEHGVSSPQRGQLGAKQVPTWGMVLAQLQRAAVEQRAGRQPEGRQAEEVELAGGVERRLEQLQPLAELARVPRRRGREQQWPGLPVASLLEASSLARRWS
mmetsp:Transcript_47580/g.77310  ORF Transcript_47580/g.77310 Transcript_47580/m.77310 type:complete len:144 (-) Transcript_47580:1395-1826(-)